MKKEHPMNPRRFQTAIELASVLLGGVLSLPLTGAAESPFALPRYRLQVGQELIYSSSREFKYEGGQSVEKSTWQVWIVRQNRDDWRLVIRHGINRSRTAVDGKTHTESELVTFSYCDIRPNGRMEEFDSFGFGEMPSKLLPPLPENEDQARRGWTVKEEWQDGTLDCRLLPEPAGADSRSVEVVREAPVYIITGRSLTDTVTFDMKRGLPEKIGIPDPVVQRQPGKRHQAR
jgi:hypothetical protein